MPALPVVGFLDSGVGGLTVWRESVRLLPGLSTVYLADNAHCPYGPRPPAELQRIVEDAVDRLLAAGCGAVVLACNTATAAAVDSLRERHPDLPIIGMEPAVKPAAGLSRSGVVGVLATNATLHGRLFLDTSARYASGVRLIERNAGDLVPFVERGDVDGEDVRATLRRHLEPMLAAGADHIVLGCTHFPFLARAIRDIAGPSVAIVDPAPAVARQLARRLGVGETPDAASDSESSEPPRHRFLSTGAPVDFGRFLALLDGTSLP